MVSSPPVRAKLRSIGGWHDQTDVVVSFDIDGQVLRLTLIDEDVAWLVADLPFYRDKMALRRAQREGVKVQSESSSGNDEAAASASMGPEK